MSGAAAAAGAPHAGHAGTVSTATPSVAGAEAAAGGGGTTQAMQSAGTSGQAGVAGAAGGQDPSDPLDNSSDPNDIALDPAQWQPYPEVAYPDDNPYSAEKALLGKALFWDEQLSSDNTVACGTCHRPAAGGSDPRPALPDYLGHPGPDNMRGTPDDPHGSPGIAACQEADAGGSTSPLMDETFHSEPRLLFRRSLSTLDAMFSQSMFWDARVGQVFLDPVSGDELIAAGAALEAQAVHPILNASEMACEGRTWTSVVDKLKSSQPLALASQLPADLQEAQSRAPTYAPLFEAAFGDGALSPARIAMALATYERTLTANQTPWDRWRDGDPSAMSDQEKRGFQAFVNKGNCMCCHTPPLFAGMQLFDDGFHERSFDGGAAQIGGMPGEHENPQFRTVSIRNAGLREPAGLLHDGLAPGNSLEDLIAAYNEPPLHSVSVCRRALGLSAEEQSDLVAFVRSALSDPRAAQELPPFDRPKLASEP